MAITTLSGALVGMQPLWYYFKNSPVSSQQIGKTYTYWAATGFPGQGVYNNSLNGLTYSSTGGLVAGQIPHFDPVTGNSYLSRFQGQIQAAAGGGVIFLCDRIWDNGNIVITSTSLQGITTTTWPNRDANGTSAGAGILLGVEVSAATGAGTPTITMGYTNSAGTGSRTGTNVEATLASSGTATFYRIGLQAGDIGVQSVQSITLSATWTSGTINCVAYRVLAALEVPSIGQSFAVDAFTGGMPQLFAGTVPYIMYLAGGTNLVSIAGQYGETQG